MLAVISSCFCLIGVINKYDVFYFIFFFKVWSGRIFISPEDLLYLSDKEFKGSCLLQFKVDGTGSAMMELDSFGQWNGRVLE